MTVFKKYASLIIWLPCHAWGSTSNTMEGVDCKNTHRFWYLPGQAAVGWRVVLEQPTKDTKGISVLLLITLLYVTIYNFLLLYNVV